MSMLTETCRPKAAPQMVDTRAVRAAEAAAREWNQHKHCGQRVWCQEHGVEGTVRSPAWEHLAEPVVTVEIAGTERVVSIRRLHGVAT